MKNIFFQYDHPHKCWTQCADGHYTLDDMRKVNYIQLVYYSDHKGESKKYVFCPYHKTVEEISMVSLESVVSTEGCLINGLVSGEVYSYGYYGSRDDYIPYRWRIFQRDPQSAINIACDYAIVNWRRLDIRTWRYFSVSVKLDKRKILSTGGVFFDLPDVVTDKAIDLLQESAHSYFGIKPSVLSCMKGREKIEAFIERPFDLNIVYLKTFLRYYINGEMDYLNIIAYDNRCVKSYNEIFAYEEKDNYRIICQLLNINPPKSLRKAYAYNPYAIVWYMVFKLWGINDINLMQRFLYLSDYIGNISLSNMYLKKDRQELEAYHSNHCVGWYALDFYCRYVMENRSVKHLLKWLYKVSQTGNLSKGQTDTIMAFYNYNQKLSDRLKKKILTDGLTPYVHDAISWEVIALTDNDPNTRLIYEPRILNCECKIGDYIFRLVHNTRVLPHVSVELNNCVATYRQSVLAYKSIIVYVTHKRDYVACIEIDNDFRIVQALGKSNRRLSGELLLMCRYWAKHKGLELAVTHLDLPSHEAESDLQDITYAVIEPIPYKKDIGEMNVKELCEMPEGDISAGYYFCLVQRLMIECSYCISAPKWKTFADEKSRLQYLLPEASRIYEAAFSSNLEAMRALAILYCFGRAFPRDCKKSLQWLQRAVECGSESAHDEIQMIEDLMERIATYDNSSAVRGELETASANYNSSRITQAEIDQLLRAGLPSKDTMLPTTLKRMVEQLMT